MKLKVQPIKCKSVSDVWIQKPVMAAEEWVGGPVKPRNELRRKEVPPECVSLESLQEKGIVEVYKELKIETPEELDKIPEGVDFFVISDHEMMFVPDKVLEKLISMNKPILAKWDDWGFSWFGRASKLKLKKYSGAKYYYPFGADDVNDILGAIKAWKRIRTMRVIYIGDLPSHSVMCSDRSSSFEYLGERFGTDFVHLDFSDYIKAVEGADEDSATRLAKEWESTYSVVDGREKKLKFYAKVYLGLRNLLRQHNANVITMDCAWLPDTEYVPCFAYSKLIDEGTTTVCEADIPALYAMVAMMEFSGGLTMMGNLNENATHADIEKNIVTINHDLLPLSMCRRGCRPKLRDFHASGKGLTLYADLEMGRTVTLAGMHPDMDKLWTTRGSVQWSEDTTHCRITVGIKVDNAKRIGRSAFGDHIVMAYGDHIERFRRLAELLEMEHIYL